MVSGVSGLASSIRSATDSATFDLAGYDASSIQSILIDALSAPLPVASMIRITLIVGGGKSSRQRYDDGAMRGATSALRGMGFVEDRGASCVDECAGRFKTQHDTGKNVFTVVIFPRVAGDGDGESVTYNDEAEPLVPTDSPGYKIAVCRLSTFQNLLASHCPTYFEKRECLRCLEGLLQVEQAIVNKMMHGHPLDSGEKSFYDEFSDLHEKYAHTQGELSRHVDEGRLTAKERDVLVEMNDKRIEALMNEPNSASVAEKLKKSLARKHRLSAVVPVPPPALRHEPKIATLRKRLLPLIALEKSSRGRLLTLSETRSLTEKENIDAEIIRLEEASRGFFEKEDAFQERVRRSRERFDSKSSKSKQGGGKAGTLAASRKDVGNVVPVNKWILPGEKPRTAAGGAGVKTKLKGKGGAVFTAMMMDSPSDEEEETELESADSLLESKSYTTRLMQLHPATINMLTPKKVTSESTVQKSRNPSTVHSIDDLTEKEAFAGSPPQTETGKKNNKKKKKKSKKSALFQEDAGEDESRELDRAIASNEALALSAEEPLSSVSESLLHFWQSFLLPSIIVIIDLLVSLVTSLFAWAKTKKGGKKKRR